MTPLQLAAFMSAIANGGTLYYLQHPQTMDEVATFEPKVKRRLQISQYVPALEEGMLGTTLYGTGRSLRWNYDEEQVFGKTGTCSESGIRYGWFGSIANTQYGKLVAVTFLQGGRPTFGPKAAEITGRLFKNLQTVDYFASRGQRLDTTTLETSVGVRQ
jgi:cell division protein FtsI/penicillin-binding protein 2